MAAIVGRTGSAVAYVGDSETLTSADKLKNVTTFTLPSAEADEIDVSDFDSVGKETESGDIDYGEVTITQHLNTSDQFDDMQDRIDTGNDVYFALFIKNKADEIVIGRKGKGIVKSVSVDGVERGSAITIQTTIKVSGACTKVTSEPTA